MLWFLIFSLSIFFGVIILIAVCCTWPYSVGAALTENNIVHSIVDGTQSKCSR